MKITNLRCADLFYLAEYGKTEDIALQAWNLLKVDPNLTVDILNNLAEFGKTEDIQIEAQRAMFNLPNLTVDIFKYLAEYGKTGDIKIEARYILGTDYYQYLNSLL